MKLIQIIELVKKGNNLIFYNKDVSICHDKFEDEYLCIFFDEPVPIRIRLIKVLKLINPDYKVNPNHITIAELKEIITKEIDGKNLIIFFNNFEKLSRNAVDTYEYLNNVKNIQFICSFNKKFRKEAYYFYKKFKFINKKDYHPIKDMNQINITYAIYIILSIYCFLIYIKISASVYMATIMIGAVWFALIIFRTLMYAGGRI